MRRPFAFRQSFAHTTLRIPCAAAMARETAAHAGGQAVEAGETRSLSVSLSLCVCVCVCVSCSTVGDVRCRLPAIIMPGLELQVTLGQTVGDEPPLAVVVRAGATPADNRAVRTPLNKSLCVATHLTVIG